MIPKPTLRDIKLIGYYSARIIIGYGLLTVIPIFISFLLGEYDEGLNFIISFLITLIVGYGILLFCPYSSYFESLSWLQGMIIVSLTWLIIMFLGTIPFMLSGHFSSYIDACFDTMSGLATIGLYVMQDLDHASYTLKTWRMILPYLGGQGIILIALTFLIKASGAYDIYSNSTKEDRILPNIFQTARIILKVSLIFFICGTLVLWIAGINIGLSYKEAFWHSIWLFMGSSVNSGFAPQSISLLYYHSCVIEIITVVIFIIGAFNFSFHYALCTGNRKEIYKNIEVIVFIISISILSYIVFSGLEHQGIYSDVVSFIRKGLYILASAHTTTGHMTIYPSHFVSEWGAFAMLGIIIAMAIGGCTGSTAGGIKVLRIGLISKGMYQYIRKLAFPSSAVIKGKFHHIKELVLDDTVIYSAMLIVLCYILTYCLGAVIGVYYGYPFLQALFESVSATSTCGLSCGVVSPDMPIIMKIVFILQMWLGRLEFISIFVLIGFILSGTKKLRFKG